MKAYKLELLILDHDEVGQQEIQTIIETQKYPNRCIAPDVMGVECVEIGEWNDDHPLNKLDKQREYFETIFHKDSSTEELKREITKLREQIYSLKSEKESVVNVLNNLNSKLEPCTLYAADVTENTIGLEFVNKDKVSGLIIGQEVKVLIPKK